MFFFKGILANVVVIPRINKKKKNVVQVLGQHN